jgi:PKD repeat protein
MMTWLKNDLAATDKNWIIAFWHHPPYSKGSHDSDTRNTLIDMRKNALPILESYGVDMVFTGHSHSYERSFLIDGHYDFSDTFNSSHMIDSGDGRIDGDGVYQKSIHSWNAGTIYTVAGASGKIEGGQLDHPAMFSSLNELGSVVLDINQNRIKAAYLRSDGRVTDYFTITKGDDSTAPNITEIEATEINQLSISFDEPVDVINAENSDNYTVNENIDVLSATANDNSVLLTTTTLVQNQPYTLTVNNVTDNEDNIIAPNSQRAFNFQNIKVRSFQDGMFPTTNFRGTEDTNVVSGDPDFIFGSSRSLKADGLDGSKGELVTLIKWDISSLPVGATIHKVQIKVEVANSSNDNFKIYAGTTNWFENHATWNTIQPHSNRGDLIGTLVPSSNGPYNINLNQSGVEMVQNWVNGSINNGIFIINFSANDGLVLRASEYRKANQRPRLNITYSTDSTNNELPNAEFTFVTNSLDVIFTDHSSEEDNIVNWAWGFDDGQVSELQNPNHHFDLEGSYNVKLTVTDSNNITDTISKNVAVSNPTTTTFQQGLNNYTGAEDTYVASGSANSNYGSTSFLLADGDDGPRNELISLLKWDLSSIPNNAIVSSASITLQIENTTDHHYNLMEMQAPWDEDDATWNNSQPESNRGVIAGKFTPTSRGLFTFSLNNAGISVIQNWLNGQPNHGFTIESNGTNDGLDMRSSEYQTQAKRPMLTITYQ